MMTDLIVGVIIGAMVAGVTVYKLFSNKLEELEEKHWNECRQIAKYDDELRRCKNDCRDDG